jgi:hypothetical protein
MSDNSYLASDWAGRLASQLMDLDGLYSRCVEIERGTSNLSSDEEEALGIYGAVQEDQYLLLSAKLIERLRDALEELPQFEGGKGLTLLRALQTAVVALNFGNTTRLVAPNLAQRGSDHVGQNIYKANAVVCVRILESAEINNSQSRAFVVKALNDAGHRWKEGAPLNATTLYGWLNTFVYSHPLPRSLPYRNYIERKLASVRQTLGDKPAKDAAKEYVLGMASNPFFSVGLSI